MTRLAILLAAALPLAAAAQLPPAPPTAPADPAGPVAPLPPAPAAAPQLPPATAPASAPARAGVAVELGGWLAWSSFATFGGLASNELPRAAVPPATERTFGMSVRQSRLRAALGLPADGLLAGARLEGLVEVDFMGGAAGGDASLPLVRLRHGWVSATWKDLERLSVLVGQGWGLVGGPNEPVSLGHLAVPRFAGAGFLYRRAPQLRVSVETDGPLSVQAQLALLAPMDRATSPAATAAAPDRPPATGVGERSGLPDVEGRLALRWRPSARRTMELGLSGHAGREKWRLTSGGDRDATVDGYAGALDARLDVAWLTVHGGLFYGKNLDVLNTLSSGVTLSLDAAGNPLAATGVETWGGWGQVLVRPRPWLTLLAGAGSEAATRADLPANPASATVPRANLQGSGGALVELTSRWQAGVEYTTYRTTWAGLTDRDLTAGQLEVSTRYCF
jgi:hypothetical protein